MPNVLVTGGNRGLGLAWVRQFAEEGWHVVATCRHPAEAVALRHLAERHRNVTILRLDVTVLEDVRAVHWELEGKPLDILLNNAGVYLEKGTPRLGTIRYEDWLRTLEVNTLGAIRVTEALVDNVESSDHRLVVVTTSHMGSIADIGAPGDYYYRSSKAALNAAARGLAEELRPRGVGLLLLHPGGVVTRMGPASGLSPEESVRGMRQRIAEFDFNHTGRFFRYDGEELPW